MIALAIVALLVVCNTISYKFGSNTAKVTTFTKFLPLIMIIFIGIIFSCLGKGDNFFKSQIVPANDNSENTFSFTGMLSACPAIMFSFDGFLVVGAITNRLKNPKKDIPLSILIAMGISAVVYILITVAQLLLGASSAFNVFEKIGITNQDTITALSIILSVFMFVSSIGVLNSLSMASVHACEAAVENNTLYGSQ
jgi:amino acid transporter